MTTPQAERIDAMARYPAKAGMPTATKSWGAEWYYPAVTCAFGRPEMLRGGSRHETRGKAKAEAKRLIEAAIVNPVPEDQ